MNSVYLYYRVIEIAIVPCQIAYYESQEQVDAICKQGR